MGFPSQISVCRPTLPSKSRDIYLLLSSWNFQPRILQPYFLHHTKIFKSTVFSCNQSFFYSSNEEEHVKF
ncbi:hypothetical protein P8452_66863 [Trifolium repens]|nr:hypothetical protein P8452_66863 [Trifolium repens]